MLPNDLTVRHVMDSQPVRVGPDCSVQEVLRMMNERRIGSVLVVEEGNTLAGIFSERDLLRRVAGAVIGWRDYPVRDWMTANPHTIGPDAGWDEAVGKMETMRVRHLPVIEDGRVIGIVSSRMLMAHRAAVLNTRVEERTAVLQQVNELLLARDTEMLHYMRTAGRIQNKVLLPQAPPDWPELRWGINYQPFDHLGGDYYDFATPSPDHLGFLIADASGHSIPAALVAIMARFIFAEVSANTIHPGAVLTEMNQRLHSLIEDRFVTAFYGVADRRTGVFRYAVAGHPPPLRYVGRTGHVQPLNGQGFMLGVMPDERYKEREVVLEPGDRVCFYTDGLIESRNEIGELYGNDRLMECLKTQGESSANDLLKYLLDSQKQFSGSTPLSDDMTIVIADILPPDEM